MIVVISIVSGSLAHSRREVTDKTLRNSKIIEILNIKTAVDYVCMYVYYDLYGSRNSALVDYCKYSSV